MIGNSHLSLLDSLTFLTKITELFVICISGKHMCMLKMNECWMKAITLKITHFQYFFCWTPALQQGYMNLGLFIWSIHEVLFSEHSFVFHRGSEVTDQIFWENLFFSLKRYNRPKIGQKWIFYSYIRNNLKWKILWFSVFLCKPHIWKDYGSQVTSQNVLVKLDCKILWSSISLEGINWYLKLFCMEITTERQKLRLLLLNEGYGQIKNSSEGNINWFWMKQKCFSSM